MITVEKERHEVQDMESLDAVTDVTVELGNSEEALRVLASWSSADGSAMRSVIKGLDCAHGALATTLTQLQVAKGYLLPR